MWVTVAFIFSVSVVLVVINLVLINKRISNPGRQTKLIAIAAAFLYVPLLGPAVGEIFHLSSPELFLWPTIAGALALLLLTVVNSDSSS